VALLDRLEGLVPDDAPFRLLDVGTGTGTLVLGALERWPLATATAIDPSRRMLEFTRAGAEARGTHLSARLELRRGDAERLPVDSASGDVAISSFVLQLVGSRAAALREIRRALRPGGLCAILTWQADSEPFEPEAVLDDVYDELDVSLPDIPPGDTRPFTSPRAAASELRSAGFRRVSARRDWLEHRFTPRGYVDVAEHWIEDDVFSALDEPRRAELRDRVIARLEQLDPEELVWRRPLVSVVGRAP
jgi:SAM-dependent methyltransferase